MNVGQFADLREPSFSSSDFQVGVRNDQDEGNHGGKLANCRRYKLKLSQSYATNPSERQRDRIPDILTSNC